MQKKILKKIRKGFTLLEVIIYVALASVALVSIVGIGQNLITGNVKAQAERELSSNIRSVMNQITQNIRGADNVITGSSTFNTHPGVLTLDYPGSGTDVVFDTYDKSITLPSGVVTTIKKLRIKEGSQSYQDLTSDRVDVNNFVVRNLTRGTETKNINIELTLKQINPSNSANYNASVSVETAVSLRR